MRAMSPRSWQEPKQRLFKQRRQLKPRKVVLGFSIALASAALLFTLFLTLILAWISRDLPDPNILIAREVTLTTKLYDSSGTHLLYEVHGDTNRSLIKLNDLPQHVSQATIAIEDKSFYTHRGIYWRGLARAMLVSLFSGQRVKGTSTLTQQLVKNAILTNERSFLRKLKEMLLSLQMERVFTKDQILQMYLNEIPYGSTMYGIESAARTYFDKAAKDLTLDEAALLAALPQAPDLYSPYGTGSRGDNRVLLVRRQHYILSQMAAQGYITKSQADEAKKLDTLKKLSQKKLGAIKAPHFVMYVRSLLIEKYGQKMTENRGLKVITSLDWDKQRIAEEEIKKGVAARGRRYGFTNASLVALDPKTGQILTMVGSKDFFDTEHDGQVNVALRPRQPGSSFKPIVYIAGLIKGYTPKTTLWDVNTVFKTDLKDYEPKNYDFKEHGPISVRQALQGSLNIPAVKMLYLVGVSQALDFAQRLGYTTLGERSRFGLSLVLGGGEVKLLEHTMAYATFANAGMQQPLNAIKRVEDSSGASLYEWRPSDGKRLIERDAVLRLSDILSDNAARAFIFGIQNYLTLSDRPVAVKTGTTNNFHDAWTLGYTPSLAAGVWVGNNDNTEMKRGADGSQVAAPIWQAFMKRALAKTPVEKFPPPPPTEATKPILLGLAHEVTVKIDRVSNKRATELTPPEMIEERHYREAHDILWYVDKDDPLGPQPEDPARDPQFKNWEAAVQLWVAKTNWLFATSTPPPDIDDVHTTATQPQITILAPTNNQTLNTRNVNLRSSITSTRPITRVEVWSEGHRIGLSIKSPDTSWTMPVQFPNRFERGFHDLTVIAVDAAGNRGKAVVTVNLNADPQPLDFYITEPKPGASLMATSFPVRCAVMLTETVRPTKLDLYLQTPEGSTRLIGTSLEPRSGLVTLMWNDNPGRGTYVIFPIVTDTQGNTTVGEQVTVGVE